MLSIAGRILDDIFAHSMETYPEECCGILVGLAEGDNRTVTESHRANNVATEHRRRRYMIDPKKHFQVDKATRGLPVDIIGFYHSHPDHPSRPSACDIETDPLRGLSYLIVSVDNGGVASYQSWIILDGEGLFVEESIDTGRATTP